MKKILSFLFLFSFININIAFADSFSLSGLFARSTQENDYNANYQLTDSQGKVHYFVLSQEKYESYVDKNITFQLEGTEESFTVISVQLSESSNEASSGDSSSNPESPQLPKTGADNYWLLILIVGVGVLPILKKAGKHNL